MRGLVFFDVEIVITMSIDFYTVLKCFGTIIVMIFFTRNKKWGINEFEIANSTVLSGSYSAYESD